VSWISGLFVAVAVAVMWLAAAGYVRLRHPLDRLHCATFVNAGAGLALLAACLAAEGVSDRAGNILVVVAVNLLGGAAASYATARALRLRGSLPEVD